MLARFTRFGHEHTVNMQERTCSDGRSAELRQETTRFPTGSGERVFY